MQLLLLNDLQVPVDWSMIVLHDQFLMKYISFREYIPEFDGVQLHKPHHPLNLTELGMILNDDDKQKRNFGYQKFAFNLLVSDRVGARRTIPDVRHKL